MISEAQQQFFKEEGYLIVRDLLSLQEVSYYSKLYDAFLNNSIDASRYRSDLSGASECKEEKITQIMVPSKLVPGLLEKAFHLKAGQIAKELLGEDMALDFDMLINKAPNSNAITPWHQDAAYWIDMPDRRAVSCWVAIDRATIDNGCMWYTPKSQLGPLLIHEQTDNKGALQCKGTENDSIGVELEPGSCVFHDGHTLHYSRGNTTHLQRRAFITNFRPEAMIELERLKGYDHAGERKVK